MSRRFAESELRYIKEEGFEQEALALLYAYGAAHGAVTAPPIPVDDIVEMQLRLTLEFHDMQQLFGVSDVHGALWVNERRIGIEQALDPAEHPVMRGRYHFTLAHEAGHWLLHRHLFQKQANQLSLLPEGAERPEYICRSSDKTPIEFQADRFASCLLIPRGMLERAWQDWRGNLDPISVSDLCSPDPPEELCNTIFQDFVRPLARQFEVSPEAMRIRAETIGFLLKDDEPRFF